jgi:hypothetical protein
VSGDHPRTGGTDHGAQPDRDDDGVVGVADHGEEVGYQVDRHQEVPEQQPEPDSDTSRHAAVRCQPAQQPDHVREQPHPLTQRGAITAAARHGENTDEREPEHQQATAHREYHLLPPAHTAQCAHDCGSPSPRTATAVRRIPGTTVRSVRCENRTATRFRESGIDLRRASNDVSSCP